MRLSSVALFLVSLAGGAIAITAPALAAGGGTVTSLTVSPSTVAAGGTVKITVHGHANGPLGDYCEVAIVGIPGYPGVGYQFPGYLSKGAATLPLPFPNVGTYKLTATGQGDCNGSASATVTVVLGSAATGNITGATISPNPAPVTGKFDVAIKGNGYCFPQIDGVPFAESMGSGYQIPTTITLTPLVAGTYDVYVHALESVQPGNGQYGPCTGGAHVKLVVSGPVPTIVKLRYLEVKSPPRPDPAMIYAGEDLKLDIIGNIDNASSKGMPPFGCNWELDVIPDKPGEPGKSIGVNVGGVFGIIDFGPAPGPGSYHLVAKGTTLQGSPALPCRGQASMAAYFWPRPR